MQKSELLLKSHGIYDATVVNDDTDIMLSWHDAHVLQSLPRPVCQPQKARLCERFQGSGSALHECSYIIV